MFIIFNQIRIRLYVSCVITKKKFLTYYVCILWKHITFNVILCDHMGYDFHGSKVIDARSSGNPTYYLCTIIKIDQISSIKDFFRIGEERN